MPSKSKVCFFFDHTKFRLENRTRLKKFIESIFKKEKKRISYINFIFCSDKQLLTINQEFLHRDYYTDTISFDLSEVGPLQGEVYISVNRVKDNCKTLGITFKAEIHRVVFHGALHLCGYNDITIAGRDVMKTKEDHYLKQYF